ncbi:MAG: hypothetical protein LBJ08_01170 [Bifidobacteriaceae bacterium]|jgi:hypothetical protein|nr:hypothetical protein [Bifidobacteriaceae bacterium]
MAMPRLDRVVDAVQWSKPIVWIGLVAAGIATALGWWVAGQGGGVAIGFAGAATLGFVAACVAVWRRVAMGLIAGLLLVALAAPSAFTYVVNPIVMLAAAALAVAVAMTARSGT